MWIGISIITYFVSTFRKELLPPLIEVLINSFLLIGCFLNVVIAMHLQASLWVFGNGPPLWLFTNFPIGLLFIFQLIKNQQRVIKEAQKDRYSTASKGTELAWKILTAPILIKYPLLLLFSLPIIFAASSVLLLFGQKPDSIIQAFTQTYKQGFSELDYLCDNVVCGGHYLCTVAAKGHKNIVKPQRYGIRNGSLIICNRQLLVSNAFEDTIYEKYPKLHEYIRRNYDKVGDLVERHYHFFEYKIISDAVWLLMKPAEWLFVLWLYCVDKNPENRIAMQYIEKEPIKE